MRLGLDYSAGAIKPSAITSLGYDFVARYTSDPALGTRPKLITPGEYADLRAAALGILLFFEDDIYDYTGGYLQGVVFATRALAGAESVGYTGPLFMTVDTPLNSAQLPVAVDYQEGCAHVLGERHGVYGFKELIEACAMKGIGSVYWLAGHQPDSNSPAHIWQRNDGQVLVNGTECDVNVVLKPFLDGGDDLAAVPQAQWDNLYQQVCGQFTAWAGGTTGDPQDPAYDLIQWVLRNNVDMTQLTAQVNAIKNNLAPAPTDDSGQLSDADVQRIAVAVIKLLDQRLAQS